MNKLITYNDGSYMPLWQKDLEFLQGCFKEPFVKLCETLLGKTYGIITGCKITKNQNYTTVSEGLVLVAGEIVHCPAQTIMIPLGVNCVLTKKEGYDASGDKVFKINDGTEVRRTYYTPYMQLTNGIDLGGQHVFPEGDDAKNLIECLHDAVVGFEYELKSYDAHGITSSITIFYAKIGKVVHVLSLTATSGMEMSSSNSGGETTERGGENADKAMPSNAVYTFPEGFKPARDSYFSYWENSTEKMMLGKVAAADGKIYLNAYRGVTAVAFTYLTE